MKRPPKLTMRQCAVMSFARSISDLASMFACADVAAIETGGDVATFHLISWALYDAAITISGSQSFSVQHDIVQSHKLLRTLADTSSMYIENRSKAPASARHDGSRSSE